LVASSPSQSVVSSPFASSSVLYVFIGTKTLIHLISIPALRFKYRPRDQGLEWDLDLGQARAQELELKLAQA
jgi:hypothetical protein